MKTSSNRPVVLSLSGHDPTGGAGIQADIETLFRLGCHPCTVITVLTEQDTCDVRRIFPQNPVQFLAQAQTLIDDLPPAAIKIGLLGSAAMATAVSEIVARMPGLPIILDPVLASGGGQDLCTDELVTVLRDSLLPRTTVLTPNTHEARRLSGKIRPDDCAEELLRLGCDYVLITGTHDECDDVVNRLYGRSAIRACRWPRLPGTYHGSGCTLAAATAGFLARGLSVENAVEKAQALTWDALQAGYALGRGQLLPDRRASGDARLPSWGSPSDDG